MLASVYYLLPQDNYCLH